MVQYTVCAGCIDRGVMNRDDVWMTVGEAAKWSGYNAEHIRTLVRRGDVYAEKRGGIWWVSRESVREYKDAAEANVNKKYGPRTS